MAPTLVLVGGYPGTGKTSLARHLSRELKIPLVAKDAIKEPLFDTLGLGDLEWSHRLGEAAMRVLFAQVEATLVAGLSIIAEANFENERSTESLREVLERAPADVVRVVLHAEPDALIERFRERARKGDRHPGHLDALILDRLVEMVRQPYVPPDAPGPVIEVGATDLEKLDFDVVTDEVRRALSGA